jgi:hypothetical protein
MVDEETHDVSAGPAGAPPNRDARRDSGVIEGEVAAREAEEREPPPSATAAPEEPAKPAAAPSAEPPRANSRGALAGALAGLVVSALAFGAGYTLLASKPDVADNANRLTEVEAQLQREDAEARRDSAAVSSLDKRVSSLEASAGKSGVADLDKRVAALETSNAENAPNAAVAAQAEQQLATQVKSLRADIDAARGEIPGLATRVAKLETEAPKANETDLSALAARLDKVEAALAAPKSETRAAADNAAAIAIIAGAIEEKLGAGAPFGTEVAALKRLGVDPAHLAALEAVADGAPTGSALATSFEAVAPQVLAASQEEKGGVIDRLLAHLRGLVQVRDLNGAPGDDPQATVSRIEADCRRGDISGALAAFDKLPAAARQAAGDWPVKARARQAADAALQSIRATAIGQLAGGGSP